jgi:NMD protein affecting ribosome stability and mRNA decay
MTEDTKQRLRARFEQILAAADKEPQTLADMEEIALRVREQVAQATLDELTRQVQEPEPTEREEAASETGKKKGENETGKQADKEIEPKASKIVCPHCQRSAWYKAPGIKGSAVDIW